MKLVARTAALSLATLTILAGSAIPASACTPGLDYRQTSKTYFRSVTSVYRVVAEDFKSAERRYPQDSDFTVRMRPIEAVWGEPHRETFTLTYSPGMCNDWMLWPDDESAVSLNGREYFVFAAPPSESDPTLLKILPVGSMSEIEAMVMLGRLQMTGLGPPEPDDMVGPFWPPKVETPRPLPRWFWIFGASLVCFILGAATGWLVRSRLKRLPARQ